MDVLDIVELFGNDLAELGFNFKLEQNITKDNTFLKIWKITDKEKQSMEQKLKKAQRDVNDWIQLRKVHKQFFGEGNEINNNVAGGEKPK